MDFKVAKWAKYKLLIFRGNHLINTLAAVVFVPSVFGENIPTVELGQRKKIAKFLMRTFTCRSTFLYDVHCTVQYSFKVRLKGAE
jgi:hypothetical protein